MFEVWKQSWNIKQQINIAEVQKLIYSISIRVICRLLKLRLAKGIFRFLRAWEILSTYICAKENGTECKPSNKAKGNLLFSLSKILELVKQTLQDSEYLSRLKWKIFTGIFK